MTFDLFLCEEINPLFMKEIKIKNLVALFCLIIASELVFSQDTIKSDFKPSGKIWGYSFGDIYYKVHADSMNRGCTQYSNVPKDFSSFDVRRIYLGYDYSISEKFSTELILAYDGNNDASGNRTVLIRSANLRWKNIYPLADLMIGQSATPTFALISEKIWGYRSVEKTPTDMRKWSCSNDVGLALQGKLNKKGDYGYNLMIGNGMASKPETDLFKKIYGEVYFKFMEQKLIIDLYSDFERKQLTPYHKSLNTYKIFAAYTTERMTIGIEAGQQTQKNYSIYEESAPSLTTDTNDVTALFVSGFFKRTILMEKLGLYFRVDFYNPDTKYNSDYTYSSGGSPNTECFLLAGLDYTPHKNIHIMPNIWYNSYNNRTKGVTDLSKQDYDLVTRITFYYVFK